PQMRWTQPGRSAQDVAGLVQPRQRRVDVRRLEPDRGAIRDTRTRDGGLAAPAQPLVASHRPTFVRLRARSAPRSFLAAMLTRCRLCVNWLASTLVALAVPGGPAVLTRCRLTGF